MSASELVSHSSDLLSKLPDLERLLSKLVTYLLTWCDWVQFLFQIFMTDPIAVFNFKLLSFFN